MSDLFTKLEVAAWGGLVGAQGRLFLRIEDDLRRQFGLTHAEFEVLLRLCFAPSSRARIQDLAAASLLTRSGTSRVVERLVRAGHVERAGAEEDGRGAYAVLTKAGRDHFLTAARQHVALVRREFLSKFSAAELEQMASFWRRIEGREPPKEAPPRKPRARSKAGESVRDETDDDEVRKYNAAQRDAERAICDTLAERIDAGLDGAERKVWHRSPVWFLAGNPVVGYSVRKHDVQLLFWSGQSFDEPGLHPAGKFKAAELRLTDAAQLKTRDLRRWLQKAKTIQWDYANIVKRRGALEKLGDW